MFVLEIFSIKNTYDLVYLCLHYVLVCPRPRQDSCTVYMSDLGPHKNKFMYIIWMSVLKRTFLFVFSAYFSLLKLWTPPPRDGHVPKKLFCDWSLWFWFWTIYISLLSVLVGNLANPLHIHHVCMYMLAYLFIL